MNMRCRNHHKTTNCRPGARRAPGRRLAAAALLAVAVLLLFSGIVSAHAALVRSEPAPNSVLSGPPDTVTIWFTESVEPRLSKIDVLDAVGQRVNTEEASVLSGDHKALIVRLPRLPDGTYTVSWRNISSVDGDPSSGSFVFSIGVSPSAVPAPVSVPKEPVLPPPAELVLRWLGILSILAIVGWLAFELLIVWPVLFASPLATLQSVAPQLNSRTFKLVWLAAGIFATASIGEMLFRSSVAYSIPLSQTTGSLVGSFLQTGWGSFWLWRMEILIVMFAVLVLAFLNRQVSGGREWQIVALVLAAGVLFTLSLTSHGAAITEIRTAAVFSDYLHLLAASVWVGGIFYLALVVPPVMKSQRQRNSTQGVNAQASVFCPETHVTAIGRFSMLAMLSVGTLLITGLFSSWAQVTVLPALATPYGVALLTKLSLIVPLLILGAVNRLRVRLRLPHDRAALQLLHKTVTAEAVMAALVLLSVATLVNLEPARQVASRQAPVGSPILSFHENVNNLRITLQVAPGRVGSNTAELYLQDDRGNPVRITQASLRFRNSNTNLELLSPALSVGQGKYVVEDIMLPVAGDWQLEVLAIRPDAFDTRVSFPFKLLAGGATVSTAITPSARTGNLLWGVELLLLGFLFGGVGLYSGARGTRTGMVIVACGVISILTGVLMAIVSLLA